MAKENNYINYMILIVVVMMLYGGSQGWFQGLTQSGCSNTCAFDASQKPYPDCSCYKIVDGMEILVPSDTWEEPTDDEPTDDTPVDTSCKFHGVSSFLNPYTEDDCYGDCSSGTCSFSVVRGLPMCGCSSTPVDDPVDDPVWEEAECTAYKEDLDYDFALEKLTSEDSCSYYGMDYCDGYFGTDMNTFMWDSTSQCCVILCNHDAPVFTEKTVNINHGGFSGAIDPLPETPAWIISVSQSGLYFFEPVDYLWTLDEISWAPMGNEPAPGSTYQVTYEVMG